MEDQKQLEARAQERAQIAACDPLTVIGEAKSRLYKGGSDADPWLEEVVSRFDQQTRAALGSHLPSFVPAGSSSG